MQATYLKNMVLKKNRKSWSINACISRKPYPEIVHFAPEGDVGGIVDDLQPHNAVDKSDDTLYKVNGYKTSLMVELKT